MPVAPVWPLVSWCLRGGMLLPLRLEDTKTHQEVNAMKVLIRNGNVVTAVDNYLAR